jgi:PAS domain S-box-containing protein
MGTMPPGSDALSPVLDSTAAPLGGVATPMNSPVDHVSAASAPWVRKLQYTARAIGLLVAVVGAGHLIAWLSGYMAERGLSTITMKTNAALELLLTGVGLVLVAQRHTRRFPLRVGQGLAVIAAAIGAITLSENLTGWNLGIDQLLAEEQPGALGTFSANRMGVPASNSFLLAGLALLLLSRGGRRSCTIAQWFALAVCLIALLACTGYLYGAQQFYAITRLTAIAWPTAVTLLALGLGLLCARPAQGLMAQVVADDPGGIALRRWPPVLLLPIVLGWLRLAGERRGWFDAATGTALVMILFMIALAIVAYRSSIAVSRSSAAITDREERLRLAHEAAGIGAFDWDVRSNTNLWTPELEAIHGLPPGGLRRTRETWEELVHPEDRTEMIGKVDTALSTGEPTEGEWRVIWPDGSVHWVAGQWRVFRDAAGTPVRMVGVNIDITERKRMQGTVEATIHDLERSNKELQQFAYICAHDLQEPLRQVQLFVQLLQRRYAGTIHGQAAEYFAHVCRGAERMADLITGVLEYSRAGTSIPREIVQCEQILQDALADLRAAIEESGARITHDALPAVSGSRTQLKQLFQNLIGNAIKFRRDGVPPRVHVGCRADINEWVFSVRDNGIGIQDAFHERVFRIFQRLHAAERYQGTGIGLAICKKIVEAHRGRIWIEPQDGSGATLCFTLSKDFDALP